MSEDAPDADPPPDRPPEGDTQIRPLDQATVERIAAGEVVERPASVVKELVENSLDAGADRIDVEVDGDGTDRIAVSDDGTGMSEADVRMAVREHTTSKIADIEDLEAGVHTLGFRGEALHTIGAVARVTIRSKPRGADGAGTELRYEGGETVAVDPVGCPAGTTVEVKDLFYNTPARRKYLKTEATEFAHVNRIVSRYALANPSVAVSLTHDGRETFATTGDGDLRAAIMSVYGREVAESMIPVVGGEDPPVDSAGVQAPETVDVPDGPLAGVAGFASHPETTRSSREYVTAFVNGRWVDAAVVREAVVEAYGGQLAADRYPFVVLFLDLPAGSVDVNVHPRKMEVRFDDEDGVREQVRTAVRRALLEDGLVRSGAPRGRSAPAETPVAPEPTDGRDPADSSTDRRPDSTDPDTEPRTGSGADDPVSRGERRAPGSGGSTAEGETGRGEPPTDPDGTGGSPVDGRDDSVAGDDEVNDARRDDDGTATAGRGDRKFAAATDQRTLVGESATSTESYDRLPRMRVLGQFDETYVVAETPDGLVLVDQHAADERIHYERLQTAFDGAPDAQVLATPVELELTAGEAATFEAAESALERLGFRAALTDSDDGERHTLCVRAVPAAFDETLAPERVRDLLASVVGDERPDVAVEELVDEFLADLACHPAVTGNTSLREGSVVDLLSALDDCENPYACPHGRPVVVELDREEIEDRFERDYPGHGHRRVE